MSEVTVAEIALENTSYNFDKLYKYIIPETIVDRVKAGMRVVVPFGFGDKQRQGMILSIKKQVDGCKMKYIEAVLDKAPLLNNEMISLVYWIKERYYCTFFDAVNVILPTGIHMKMKTVYEISSSISEKDYDCFTEEEHRIIDFIKREKGYAEKDKLIKAMGLDCEKEVISKLLKKHVIIKKEQTKRNIGDALIKMVSLTEDGCEFEGKLTNKQKEVYNLVCSCGLVSVKEICYFLGVTVSVIDALEKKGIVKYTEEEVYRDPYKKIEEFKDVNDIVLNEEQQRAYDELKELYKDDKASVSLLYGVTGSGKTSVFMKLIDEVYNDGKGIILMVPEIALTSQIINIFKNKYKDNVSVFHSALSIGERLDEWKKVRDGKSKIAIGTRSAIFAPFDNLGLIIMDEEQEYSYKSDLKPRFHARDIAKFRCNYNNGLLLLSSATPCVESYYFAKIGRYSLHKLSKRYSGSNLPNVKIINMSNEIINGNNSPFSRELIKGLKDTISSGQQAILLLNRRGYNTFVSCKNCKEVLMCPNCSISMTYHSANNKLMCHYCGYSIPIKSECPNCHEDKISYVGFGTQRIEKELEAYLPEAKILRMDTDTTMRKFSHEKKLKSFKDREYDIMIGTQMVAKGLDFPNVTFVGVLYIDQLLYNNDFRSYERTFSLLTQVVGRSGRGERKGSAVIQTSMPENVIIGLASRQDYDAFYNAEILMRKSMLYPPFVDICVVGFVGNHEDKVLELSVQFFNRLKEKSKTEYNKLPLRVVGPSVANVAKINNKYRYKIIIKFRNSIEFREMMSDLLIQFGKDRKYSDVNIFVDVNPDVIM